MASVKATYDTLKALRDGVAPSDLGNQPSSDLIAQVTRLEEYDSDTEEFLN